MFTCLVKVTGFGLDGPDLYLDDDVTSFPFSSSILPFLQYIYLASLFSHFLAPSYYSIDGNDLL